MEGSWRECTWGDLVSLEYGKRLEGYESAAGPYRVYGTNGPIGWHTEPLCDGPGVVVGRKGAYRGVHYSADPFFVIDTAFYVVPKVELDLRWAYYQLQTLDINRLDSGSAIPSTSRQDFYALPVRLPPLAEQRSIAALLASLDDKIELNRQINNTLDALGQTVFRSWFTDFDPVSPTLPGMTPRGASSAIARLFPDQLVETELGRVPAGWRIGRLADFCSTQYGYTASAAQASAGPKLLRVTDINKLPWIEWTDVPHCAITASMYERYKLHVGDVVVSRMADPGKAAIVEELMEAVFASYLIRLVVPKGWSYYVFYFLRSKEYLDYAEGVAGGTVQKNMNARVITGAPVVIPPGELAEAFDETVGPLRRRLIAGLQESRALAVLRDSLLPGLVSGEVRIVSAERLVEQAV